MLKRMLCFAYGTIAYVIFLGTFLYAIAFVGNIALYTVFACGWGLVLVVTFLIDRAVAVLVARGRAPRRWHWPRPAGIEA